MSSPIIGADLDALSAQLSQQRLERFDPAVLLWLAALPEWSHPLAKAVGVPDGSESLDQLVSRLAAAGLVERREILNASGEVVTAFWMPASRRVEVGQYLRQVLPARALLAGVDAVAEAIQALPERMGPSGTPIAPVLEQWLRVARAHLDDPSGARLIAAVDELIVTSRSNEALELLAAAQALGDVLGDPLAASARRAQWRVDRAYRQSLDARTLAYYLPQPEVDEALERLIQPSREWTVHLLGEGGVGKTMALRDLAAGRFADRMGLPPFPVARVDFDHLDPRYPERRPVEVLIALAAELAGFTTSRDAYSSMRRFDSAAAHLHELLAAPSSVDHGADETELLATAVDAFAAYVDGLAGPVVLVLDTCEELAKLHTPGGRAPAVDRTFEILERIHDQTSHVRVILAGRRWLIPPPTGPRRADGVELSPRPYLRVVPLEGFTAEMAQRYLDRRDPERLMRPPLRAALLDRCLPPGESTANPFDLACYADWALAEPDVDAERLRSAPGDPYVEQRIIGRLADTAVRDCLGVAVELGRFAPEMIEPALVRRGIDADAAFSGLVGQEWVSAVAFDTDGRPKVIEISEHLRPRLRSVIADNPDRFPVDRIRLGRDLAGLVLGRSPVDQVPVEAIEGALRLLPPSEAATMWVLLENRVARSDAWGWAAQVTPRAAAAEAERAGTSGPTVLAAIRATQAAAALRQPGRPGLAALWDDVWRLASRHPDPAAAELLAARAVCGSIAVAPAAWRDQPPSVSRLRDVARSVPEGSLVAALDALTAGGEPLDPALSDVLDDLCDGESTATNVRVASLLVRASSQLARGRVDDAVDSVEAATRVRDAAPSSLAWADWSVPPRLLDRARLARVVLASIRCEPPPSLPLDLWRREATKHVADIDSERLLAATIGLELDWQVVEAPTLTTTATAEEYVDQRQPTHHWHQRVVPLRIVLCRGMAARGDLAEAVRELRDRREVAVRSGEDPLTISACETELVGLCRSFRTTKPTSSLPRLAREGTPAIRAEAWAALALVEGESPATPEEAGSRHAWWQAQIRRAGSPPVRRPGVESEALEDESVPALVAWADTVEARTIAGSPWRRSAGPPSDALRPAMLVLERGRDRWTHDVVGAAFRGAVLVGTLDDVDAEALPPRWAALVALAEGELLALRLPQAGAELLAFAANLFMKSGDAAACARAQALQVLAVARAGGVPDRLPLGRARSLQAAATGDNDGWRDRVRLAESLLAGRPVEFRTRDRSPELDPHPLVDSEHPARAYQVEEASSTWGAPPMVPPRSADDYEASPTEDTDAMPSVDTARDQFLPPSEAAPPAPVGRPVGARRSRSRRWLLLGGVALCAVALAATILTALNSSGSFGSPGLSPWGIALGAALAAVGLVLLLIMLIGIGWGLWRGYRRLDESEAFREASDAFMVRGRHIQRTVGVDLSRPPAKLFPVRMSPTSSGLLFERQATSVGPTSPDRPLGLPVLADLPGRLIWSRRKYVVVPLLTTQDPSQAWEQELGASDPQLAGRRPLWIRMSDSGWRAGVSLWLLAARDHPQWIRAGVLFRGPRLLDPQLLAAGFKESRSQQLLGVALRLLRISDAPRSESPSPDVHAVLHLVGTPVPTAAGWRIRVAGAAAQPEAMKQSRGTLEGEQLLGPDELPAARTALAVLQAEPADGPPRPLGDLREGMCALANELRTAGAGAVLVVPPLPDSLASRVVAEISRIMIRDRNRMHPTRVLELVDHLRGLIRTAPEVTEPAPQANVEVAWLDLLLFV
jgi:hypothetical protein